MCIGFHMVNKNSGENKVSLFLLPSMRNAGVFVRRRELKERQTPCWVVCLGERFRRLGTC